MDKETVLCVGYSTDDFAHLERAFRSEGWSVWTAPSDDYGLRIARDLSPSLVLLEPVEPGHDWFDWAERLREDGAGTSTLMLLLSSRLERCSPAACEIRGIDECFYGVRPIEKAVERIRSFLRIRRLRASVPAGMRVEYHGLAIDTDKHELRVDGREVVLSLAEFQLMVALASEPGRVFTREQLLERMQRSGQIDLRNIDVRVRSIRRKLGSARDAIVTVRGVGYKLAPRRVAALND